MNTDKELEKCIGIIDDGLKQALKLDNEYGEAILESIDYSLFTGGKRIRPIIALKSYDIFTSKKNYEPVLPFAMAIEMIHTYSLIHDDLPSMDNDDIRRGKPTNHKVYGEAMAILAGDGLLNLAFETILNSFTDLQDIGEYKKKILAARNIANYSGIQGMIGGQVVDLHSEKQGISEDELLYMYRSKTAALIKAATVSGAILAGANEDEIETMREFGYCLGMAYQIRDDILDLEEDKEIDKLTYLSYFGLEKGKKDLQCFSHRAKEQLDLLKDRDVDFFIKLTDDLNERRV